MKNEVRIISGCWRGRKLTFSDQEGLRPTSDRLRETLFNWLQFKIADKKCLDAFAGSGALGFEVASREAKQVVMLEKSRTIVDQLKQHISNFEAEKILVQQVDALTYLTTIKETFDLIFLDPPFGENLLDESLRLIRERRLLNSGGLIYIEHGKKQIISELSNWKILKEVAMGRVCAKLLHGK